MTTAKTWWQLCLAHDHAEELTPLLLAEGALGIEILSGNCAHVFCPSAAGILDHLRAYAQSLGFVEKSLVELPYQDWLTQSESTLTPISRGALRIAPVRSSTALVSNDERTIFIVPGMGFGTGHHETTGMLLDLLQLAALAASIPAQRPRILDLGTGSGILAIACAKLFGARLFGTSHCPCPVEAIDIDPLAIDNARDNIGLNQMTALINTSVSELKETNGTFDLIVSNLYAEILCDLEPLFGARLATSKPILISGIMRTKEEQILATFKPERWNYREIRREGDWCAMFLTRI